MPAPPPHPTCGGRWRNDGGMIAFAPPPAHTRLEERLSHCRSVAAARQRREGGGGKAQVFLCARAVGALVV